PFVGFITIFSFISLLIPIFFYFLNLTTDIFLKLLVLISNISPKITLYFSLFHLIFYYLLIILFLYPSKRKFKIASFFLFIIFCFLYPFKKSGEKIIFFSLKNPTILTCVNGKGTLIFIDRIKNPDYFYEILYKILKNENIKIKNAILLGDRTDENLYLISKLKIKKVLVSPFLHSPVFSYEKVEIFKLKNAEEIDLYGLKFIFLNGNLVIKYEDIKCIILMNENLDTFSTYERYFLVYPVRFKKNVKNQEKINSMKFFFLVAPNKNKKFENLKSLCQNYYLDEGDVVFDLKSKIIKYWKDK
ncbi:MAG: hypothetical protein ACP5OB_02295, partial [Candidatus Ratteibacteria bacterium]